MYTYNPQWGSSLEKRKKLPRASFLFFDVSLTLILFLVVNLFICFVTPSVLLCHRVRFAIPSKKGPDQRAVCFPHCRPSLFYCPLRISPVPWFDPLRSLVIFGRVSDTSVCLGSRSEQPSGVLWRSGGGRGGAWQREAEESAGLRGKEWKPRREQSKSNETKQAGRADDCREIIHDGGLKYCMDVSLRRWRLRKSKAMGNFFFFWKVRLEVKWNKKDELRRGGGRRDWSGRGRGLSQCRQVALREPLIICAAATGSRRGQRSASWLTGANPIRQSELRMIKEGRVEGEAS